jgi:hypothetical protein
VFLPQRRRTLLGFLAAVAVVATWWLTIPASNDRRWQREVAVLPFAEQQGVLVTVHNIRHAYRSETDFEARYDTRTFDLGQLDAVDLIAVYWMGKAIAHVMIRIGFQERDFVAVSIEIRSETGEAYSTLKGIFKQYELIYIVGDERDLIRVRTDFRRPPEDVYLFRTRIAPADARPVSGLPPEDQPDARPARVEPHPDHQLHHEGGAAHARVWGPGEVQLEGSAFGLRAPVCLRARRARPPAAV